ncbi:hypothetical protein C0992_010684, partial [Termitomyces sp. T32_za158]
GNLSMAKDMIEFEKWLTSSSDSHIPSTSSRALTSYIKPHHMQNALASTLIVSPLFLLSPHNAHDAPGKDALLNLWSFVGGFERPSGFMHVERSLWRVLFDAARGGGMFLTDLLSMLESAGS